ncbi:MAG: DUF58 domain-containing protein [Pirellulaceae bacterium]|jgi:uncharacterized protein (DUF58 family)|nr:DUF58 domain-containing protein [Pirellulaceae bacterium]
MEQALQRTIEGFARAYRLALPERQRLALAGDVAGHRTGSSVEYQDRKDYVPGDDLRHVDWRAFARTDRLTVKLYREEISPRVDILVDLSASMDTSPEKFARAVELALFFQRVAQPCHALTQVYGLGSRLAPLQHPLELETLSRERVESPLPLVQGTPLASRGGIRILISDFLFPCEPRELRCVFHGADRLALVQLLSAFEAEPEVRGQWRLQEAETDEFRDMDLTDAIVRGYVSRLRRLQDDLDAQMRIAGGAFATVRDTDSWEVLLRGLLRANILET